MPGRRQSFLLITCEHAGNRIPAEYRALFAPHAALLASHRGYDPGALHLARTLARRLRAPLLSTPISRLLVEANRSLHHRELFSTITRALPPAARTDLINRYYQPHRQAVIQAVGNAVEHGKSVLHVGVHTFTPVLDGEERQADIGLLYDPSSHMEKAFCQRWRDGLKTVAPDLRVRMNYPYRGIADGLTTSLRRQFANETYAGIELEVNQGLLASVGHFPVALEASLASSLHMATTR